jgi:chaperonin cofactor prefoldin
MKKSKLDLLIEENIKLQTELEELETISSDLENVDDNIGKLDVSTLDKLMKFELIRDNWEDIRLEDIEAIIRNV